MSPHLTQPSLISLITVVLWHVKMSALKKVYRWRNNDTDAYHNHAFVWRLTLIAHFPPLEVEHCVVVGMDGQIELHRQDSLSIYLA